MGTWELRESYESSNGTVRWDRIGQGSPVVLVHGWPFSSYVWRDVAAGLARRHTVYVWDLPGYGQSAKTTGQDVSLAGHQAVLTELLEHWGLTSPAVVAHDIGAAVALRSALLDGVGYGRLVLVDAVSVRPWGSPFFRLVREHAEVFARLPAPQHEAMVRRYLAGGTHGELRTRVLDTLVQPWLGEVGQAAFYRQMAQAEERHTREVEDRFGELDMPTLIVWGEHDDWLPADRAEHLARLIPHARLEWVADSGHLVQEDAPARFTSLLTDFLAGQ
ncbi:pimeloyl-ACP methyl ester carboxylesterase [Haloactinospora alba]|uniref:Pimeloyl-ACP methyl ester carboxylesterase n=1 Tax=Haloactinospora alba TaxID=405555 RepID=A0A543NET8_9ACTN|nr:alpha/beta hydrolase [Haloactinospora alba]TQN30354.1 pimeloyl-ACP methyl ester carboxylesterase [Haloactinospora alba]